eukprot:TRINITY_DN8092_c0_g1_i1.p1 TRINITY_DN8092_c0_g1~~TRINITY_DN8092_c0_g1_i1.p1  ORF type:complete len:186 (-),score=32.71 TRINITY_DN8092_c0_g1_i1:155-712(-)
MKSAAALLVSLLLVAFVYQTSCAVSVRVQSERDRFNLLHQESVEAQPALSQQIPDKVYLNAIPIFFNSLFNASCPYWASLFSGAWYHPALPNGASNQTDLINFCKSVKTQFPYGASYVPKTASPKLTRSGPFVFVSVPYVFSGNSGPSDPFVNWGTVFFAYQTTMPPFGQIPKIAYAVETWDSRL